MLLGGRIIETWLKRGYIKAYANTYWGENEHKHAVTKAFVRCDECLNFCDIIGIVWIVLRTALKTVLYLMWSNNTCSCWGKIFLAACVSKAALSERGAAQFRISQRTLALSFFDTPLIHFHFKI
jgi:hypothetical protein